MQSSNASTTYTAFKTVPPECQKFEAPKKAPAGSRRVSPLPAMNGTQRHRAIVTAAATHFGGELYLRKALSSTASSLKDRAVAFIELRPEQLQTRSSAELNAELDLFGQATETAIRTAEAIHKDVLSKPQQEKRLTITQAHAVAYCMVREAAATAGAGETIRAQVLQGVQRAIDEYASIPLAHVGKLVNEELGKAIRPKPQDSKSADIEASDFTRADARNDTAADAAEDEDTPVHLNPTRQVPQ